MEDLSLATGGLRLSCHGELEKRPACSSNYEKCGPTRQSGWRVNSRYTNHACWMYSLDSVWLLRAERARLDAFHCRCLRRLLGIPCSYISRVTKVTNQEVLRRASSQPLSDVLASRQLALYTKIVNSDAASLVRRALCNPDGTPRSWATKRRRGRPR